MLQGPDACLVLLFAGKFNYDNFGDDCQLIAVEIAVPGRQS